MLVGRSSHNRYNTPSQALLLPTLKFTPQAVNVGTAPLNGERAQGDFTGPASWTLRHIGISQRPGTGTASSLRLAASVQERPCPLTIQRCSKDDRSDHSPLLASVSVASELLLPLVCSVLDGNSKSCRCSQSSTCPSQELGADERHGDTCASRWQAVL